jgi:ActR/RegA family two-component response regulator
MIEHAKEILLVEDLELFSTPLMRWLDGDGYRVTLAQTYDEALSALDEKHFHLAIVDIRLQDADEENEQGMTLLEDIEKRQLNNVMPCIVLTAYARLDTVLEATQKYQVARYIQKKPGYRAELLNAVRELFDEQIQVNFNLVYDGNSDTLIPEIASTINWLKPDEPQLALLSPQVKDLFGKLLPRARRVYISKLKSGLTGAAVVRVRPTLMFGPGPSLVAKISRHEKIKTEGENYEDYVKPYLPANTITRVETVYTRHLGALCYTFAESDQEPLDEFDRFYERNQPEVIAHSLRDLFQNTCRYWYSRRESIYSHLPQLYYKAFQLEQAKLIGRIHTVLPEFDPEHETFQFNQTSVRATNPIAWLTQYHDQCVLPVYHSITHGDLTGRNIMVRQDGKCWLIDFYRTYGSHILRDFVILETDIKYRLLPTPSLKDFHLLEEALLKTGPAETVSILPSLPADVQKTARVIAALRALAYEFAHGPSPSKYKEFLLSLLMATLNVVRLRHIEEMRKLQAMLSAALICAELDEMAGRRPFRPHIDEHQELPQSAATIQQTYLAQHLNSGNLILFIGSDAPPDFPSLWERFSALPWRAVYKAQPSVDELKRDMAKGKLLLVIYPSEDELDMAHQWRQSVGEDGLVWITGTHFSDEDQDHYRSLGFRVLPDDPVDLLAVFSALVQP